MVGLATCWLQPQALYGLPPSNKASLGIVRQGCWGLRGLTNRHVGRLRLEWKLELEFDLGDRLATWYALRERDRWKGLDGHWNFSI